ncbi:hypothetical protein BASA81_013158 [Batrachochytrium salamandrivorans]|nr:hypothetical protein BASA81_013158 [Batrachochytrium salamandrivorans]
MLFRSVVTAIFAVAFSSTTVSALPSGAPNVPSMLRLLVLLTKITNTAGREYFQGLLMYVATDMEPKNHLGKFTFDKDNFRPQTKSICDAAKITGDLDATFTHSKPYKEGSRHEVHVDS